MAEETIKDIKKDFLHCSICLKRFNVPKMLPCLHSFCQECLEKHVTKLKGGKLTCPTCRFVFDLPESGVKGMKTNFHLVSLGERMDLYERLKADDAVSQKCQSCKSGVVSAFCFDCDFAICDTCKSYHSLFPQLQSHLITSVENINQDKFKQSRKSVRSQFCAEHRSEKIQFYCKTCSKPICRDCTNAQHPEANHDCVESKHEFEDLAAAITECLDESEVQMQATKQFIAEGEAGSLEISRSTSAMIKKIRQHYDEIISSLEKQLQSQMENACKKVENNEKLQQTRINQIMEEAKNWVERMENTQQVTREISEENNMCELLSMSNDLIGAFKALECDSEKFNWYYADLRFGATFTSKPSPSVILGTSYTDSDIPVVLHDGQGDIILCYINHESKECIIKRLREADKDDITEAQEILSFEWGKEYYSYNKLVACTLDDSEIILALGRWLTIIDVSASSIKSHLMLDKNPNGVVENIAFEETSGNLYFTKRDNLRVIEEVNLRELMKTTDLRGYTCSSSSYEMDEFENSTKYVVGHNIRVFLYNSTSNIIILTVDGQIVKYNLDNQQTEEPDSCLEAQDKILTIFQVEPNSWGTVDEYYVLLKKVKKGQPHDVSLPVVERAEYFINWYNGEEDDSVKKSWRLTDEVKLPFTFFRTENYKLNIFHRGGVVYVDHL